MVSFFASVFSCMWDNPSIHSYFIPLGFMQGSLQYVNGGLQVFLVIALPFFCSMPSEAWGLLLISGVALWCGCKHTGEHSHTEITISGRCSGTGCEGAHFSSFQLLVETAGTIYTLAFVLHCLSRKPCWEVRISFFPVQADFNYLLHAKWILIRQSFS